MEIKNIPEIQEQDAAEKLSSLYLNSIEGDREENIKAISAAVTVKYLESLNSLEGVNTSVVFDPPPLQERVCRDPDDDKFLACAVASGTKLVVSGDKALLETSGYAGINVLTPRSFVERHLNREAE